jgi:polyphosphate kinase 2 (PPK2 family)
MKHNVTNLSNGSIVISRNFPNLLEPYAPAKIPDYLALVDHSLAIKKQKQYEKLLKAKEGEFNTLVRGLDEAHRSLIIVLQGRDAAGKSGGATRLEEALGHDARIFLRVPIGPPTCEEKEIGYLARFQRHQRMPAFGQVRVFDRSWYERLLVEPVMKLTKRREIENSYAELRAYEWLLARQGVVLVKVWMDITKNEQARRFKARKEDHPEKVSDADTVARVHWDEYTLAANEMFYRTSTEFAPWHIISSENKWYSRVALLETAIAAMQNAIS